MPAPSWRDYGTGAGANSGNGTSIALAASDVAGLANNDYMLALLYKESTAAYTATPSGWAQVAGFPSDQSTGGFKFRADLWWKRAASESGSYTWSWTGSTWRSGVLLAWSGAITTEVPGVTIGIDAEAAQNTQPSNPGITIARSNSGLLFCTWNFASSAVTTPPTGFALRYDTSLSAEAVSDEITAADDLTTTTGATGAVSATMADPEYVLSALVEIATQAAGGAATAPPPGRVALQAVNRAAVR